MARLSLRLPDTLHHRLNLQARREGVPLNQFVVFLLAERSRPAYAVVPADKTGEEQQAAFVRLRERLGSASDEEVWKILDERETTSNDSTADGDESNSLLPLAQTSRFDRSTRHEARKRFASLRKAQAENTHEENDFQAVAEEEPV